VAGAVEEFVRRIGLRRRARRDAVDGWELLVAEERPRAVARTGVDAVIRARRRA
jgi:hypothetical protein